MRYYIKRKYKYYLISLLFIFFINYQINNNRLVFFEPNFLKKKNKIIMIVLSGINGERGPANFIKGINETLPYNSKKCSFISSQNIFPNRGFSKLNYIYIPYPFLTENMFDQWINISEANKLILGPCFVPNFWSLFPDNNIWKERRFKEILKTVKGIGVHSKRVRDYLAQKSNTSDMIEKFIIIRPCSNINPINISKFNDRKIDILFFEKYLDLDRSEQGKQLLTLLRNSSKTIEQIKYGDYTKEKIKQLANDSKFIIYFSFYDTGAIGLKEIQNYGVLAFTHQMDLVINKDTSFFVPELADKYDMNLAYKIIMEKIKKIIKLNPNTKLIARKNQKINKCQNSLDDLCKSLL